MKVYQYVILILMEGFILSLCLFSGFMVGGSLGVSTPIPENANIIVEKIPMTVVVPSTSVVIYKDSPTVIYTTTPTLTPTATSTSIPSFSEYLATTYPIEMITPTPTIVPTQDGFFAQEAGKIKQLLGDGQPCVGNS